MDNYCTAERLPRAFVATVWFFELLQLCFLIMTAASIDNETQILLSLKQSLIDPMNNLRNWRVEDSSPCNWTGVTCGNDSLSVVKLDLSSMNLSGSLSLHVARLTNLNYISFAQNSLSGEIPSNLFNITGLLTIDLSDNYFTGEIPRGFANLKELQILDFSNNNLSGGIPTDISNQSALLKFNLGGNNISGGRIPSQLCTLHNLVNLTLSACALVGHIPECLGNLSQLQWLYLGWNLLTGPIPASLGNLQNMFWLDIQSNLLEGAIPQELGKLTNLTNLYLSNNKLSGKIPAELGKLFRLIELDFGLNELTGRISDELGGLINLRMFRAYGNSLTGSFPLWLANHPNLNHISLFQNAMSGIIPETLGRYAPLSLLDLSTNGFSGAIPRELCHGGALSKLILFSNRLTGMLPESLGMCRSLTRLRLEMNSLSGTIPEALFVLPLLNFATLSQNRLNGTLNFETGKFSSLKMLDLSDNLLSGTLTPALGSLQSLEKFAVSDNLLYGVIPQEIEKLSNLSSLDMSRNAFSDRIPPSLSNCTKLVYLNLSSNLLRGTIPSALGGMGTLATLDLSNNLLQGSIPSQLASSSTLESIDLSYNNLSGPVPESGIFLHLNVSYLQGNPNLCVVGYGKGLKVCIASVDGILENAGKHSDKLAAPWAAAGLAIFATLLLFVCCSYGYHRRYIGKRRHERYCEDCWEIISFQHKVHIDLQDIQSCLDANDVLGSGFSGTVYRCSLKDGRKIAVKRIGKNEHEQIGERGFKAEMEILGTLRHRNIVQLLGCCYSQKESLLVYEYMPNGNLGEALHNNAIRQDILDWNTRLNIAIETAQGLLYLHNDCVPPVLHRDIKCHNILLDAEFSAHLADFGLAKLMSPEGKPEIQSQVAGSHGYIAPEYAYTLKVDKKADIYSFGVIILELVTGKHPTDHEQFGDHISMVEWLQAKIKTSNVVLEEIVDGRLKPCTPSTAMQIESVMRIGLACTSTPPMHRPRMQRVVNMLLDIRSQNHALISKLDLTSPLQFTHSCNQPEA